MTDGRARGAAPVYKSNHRSMGSLSGRARLRLRGAHTALGPRCRRKRASGRGAVSPRADFALDLNRGQGAAQNSSTIYVQNWRPWGAASEAEARLGGYTRWSSTVEGRKSQPHGASRMLYALCSIGFPVLFRIRERLSRINVLVVRSKVTQLGHPEPR